MKTFISVAACLFSLGASAPLFPSQQGEDVELGDDLSPSSAWRPAVQTRTPSQPLEHQEEDCVPSAMVSMGGNCVCGATCTCASLLGATGGIIYLYIKYPAFVVNTLLGQLAPPVLIGGTVCGVAGCALGYYLKKRTDRRSGVLSA